MSSAKQPFLDSVRKVLEERRAYWPISVRQVHYSLLNKPPLIHAGKPGSKYANTMRSYKSLVDLVARARIDGSIDWDAIDDETRSVETWRTYSSIAPFVRSEQDTFLKGYYRNYLQSQPNHIEIVGEKNTIKGIIRPVAMEYCMPLTIGRGYSSLPPRQKMAERFRRSGKAKLILFVLSD